MNKIAIIGGGICGLAAAALLAETADITIIDPAEIGDNASGLAAGLLHPYAGLHAKLVPYGVEGLKATLELIGIAEKALGEAVAKKTGMLRIAISDEQKEDFSLTASKYPDVRWVEAEEAQMLVPELQPFPGIFIESAYVVQTKKYLEGLKKHCMARGTKWVSKKIVSLNELSNFDKIILAAGAAAKELSTLPLTPIKGQLLELEWPKSLAPLPFPINSLAYLVMSSDNKRCVAGATFERDFIIPGPDIEIAKAYLLPKIAEMLPQLEGAKILSCKAGMRASAPQHLPLIKKVADNCWVITGMGSKGLLYHALSAKKLVEWLWTKGR